MKSSICSFFSLVRRYLLSESQVRNEEKICWKLYRAIRILKTCNLKAEEQHMVTRHINLKLDGRVNLQSQMVEILHLRPENIARRKHQNQVSANTYRIYLNPSLGAFYLIIDHIEAENTDGIYLFLESPGTKSKVCSPETFQ